MLDWKSINISSNATANEMVQFITNIKPKIGAVDTETNGLNIGLHQPFLVQFGFIHPNGKEGYTYAVDLEKQPELSRQVIEAWQHLIDTGLCWQLQGWFGRTARDLIDNGICHA